MKTLAATRNIELKKLYYLDHFNEMLEFVETYNCDLLDESHHGFISRFRRLHVEDQCLFVRLANRKGRVFRLDQVRYEEISDIAESVCRLQGEGMFRDPGDDDFAELLWRLKTAELHNLVRHFQPDRKGLSFIGKADLVEEIQGETAFSSICDHPVFPPSVVLDSPELEYLLFLYFGRLEEGLGALALRDLGIVKTRQGKKKFQPRFRSREIAAAAFHFRRMRREIRLADQEKLLGLATVVGDWPSVDDAEVAASRNKTIYQLGREIERLDLPGQAAEVYEFADQFPATERAVRLHFRLGNPGVAKDRLEKMIENPSCDEEQIFAEDFYQRKFGERKVGRLTEVLRSARIVNLDEAGREYPEAAVCSWLQRNGAEALHVENLIWTQLFGVVFRERLFDDENAGFHNDFDRLPEGLNSDRFFVENESFIEKQLESLSVEGWLSRQIAETCAALEETPHCLIHPDPVLFQLLEKLVHCSPDGAVASILRDMAKNFRSTRSGFPDLIVFESETVRFIEVKSEGDQIQRHQLARIEQLRRAGFEVEIVSIKWNVDPDQVYVVVDVETTGGAAAWNRVTEIGAVKVRGGKIIDEWSSLINPERRIPRNIVKLTGITDEMVATAPKFSEIADDLREFIGESVFVAHRAKFDFGFIRSEFQRLNQHFRAATFCTVVETRRHFPGLSSYGLANLCKEFEIPLESHHRALCDARATAEILLKINEKRNRPED